jgi:hypothetical protein
MVSEPPMAYVDGANPSQATPPFTDNPNSIPSPPQHSTSSSTKSIVLLNIPISIKLTITNYLSWQSQITPLLYGYGLYHFLLSPPPTPTSISLSDQSQLNSCYLSWHKQDQLILGWLRSSLSEPLLAQVISCSTSNQLWTHL